MNQPEDGEVVIEVQVNARTFLLITFLVLFITYIIATLSAGEVFLYIARCFDHELVEIRVENVNGILSISVCKSDWLVESDRLVLDIIDPNGNLYRVFTISFAHRCSRIEELIHGFEPGKYLVIVRHNSRVLGVKSFFIEGYQQP